MQQVSLQLPADIPMPLYTIGQMTRVGRIVGLYWTNPEIAAWNLDEPGWTYIVEPSRTSDREHEYVDEAGIRLL